jgi:hypothetical protein
MASRIQVLKKRYAPPPGRNTMTEVIIRDYCGQNNVTIPKQGALFVKNQKPATGRK